VIWLKKALFRLWAKTVETFKLYTVTFIVVMTLNQLVFFGFCLNPVCIIAAMPHVILITVIIGTFIGRLRNKERRELKSQRLTLQEAPKEHAKFEKSQESKGWKPKNSPNSLVALEVTDEQSTHDSAEYFLSGSSPKKSRVAPRYLDYDSYLVLLKTTKEQRDESRAQLKKIARNKMKNRFREKVFS